MLIIENNYRSPHGFIVFLAVSIRTLCRQKPKKRKREVDRKTNKQKKASCPAVREFSIYDHAFILSPFQLLRTNQKQANLCAIQANQNAIQANWIQSTIKPPLATNSFKVFLEAKVTFLYCQNFFSAER